MNHKLPKSLLEVIEHVELNKSGWWDAALCNVVLAATWMHGKPLLRAEVSDVVTVAFNLDIPADRIVDCIDRLVNQGKFSVQANNYITPANNVIRQMETRLRDAERNEKTVRSTFIASPLEAVFWVVTNDYRLLNFDRKRRRATKATTGVCIHPTELVQILRLWEPRSTDMDQALMSGLRLPFMFYEFNSGEETASIRILKALSRFDHIIDLDPSAIRDIVLNEAVRSKTVEAQSEEEEIAIVHDALLAERSEIIAQRDAAVNKYDHVEKTLSEERKAGEALATTNVDQKEHYETRISELKGELENIQEETRLKDHGIETVESLLREIDARNRLQSAITKAGLTRGVGGGTFTALMFAGLGYVWALFGETPGLLVAISMLFVWLATWMLLLTIRVQNSYLRDWGTFRTILRARRLMIQAIVALFLAVIGNAIWQEVIRPFWFS